MADKDTPSQGSRWTSDPDTVEVADRYPPIAQPTEERTADPVPNDADAEDVVARTGRGEDTPRRYDEDADEV